MKPARLVPLGLAALLVGVVVFVATRGAGPPKPPADPPGTPAAPPANAPPVGPPPALTHPPPPVDRAAYAGSARCAPCHPAAAQAWAASHHARAERLPDATDLKAFGPAARGAEVGIDDDGPYIVREIGHGPQRLPVERLLGVAPLWQPLVRLPDGRRQITDVAWDPEKGEWFSAFATPRPRGTWGHWTGRGMAWSVMCVECHATGVDRGYDVAADRHDTVVVEHGVGCEACHGPSAAHAAAPERPPPVPAPTMRTCAPCHSRRANLAGPIAPGTPLLDGAMLLTVGLDGLYWPDGQIRDEVFGYASFRSSVMHQNGVTCTTCHDPHGGALRKPGDAQCVECHSTRPGFARHDHHPDPPPSCVDCHMPQTTYMQRHPRHDHGFVVPDPALTVEHGIPNACDRCHGERGAAWAAPQVKRWFGAELAPRARRARTLARLAAGDASAAADALPLLAADAHPYWRAVAAGMLAPFVGDAAVRDALSPLIADEDPLVRAKAIEALNGLARDPTLAAAIEPAMVDPVRAVRVAAQRALHARFEPEDPAVVDLMRYLDANADQPQAAVERARWLIARRRAGEALPWLERAAGWDPASAAVWQTLGLARGMVGDTAGAIAAFEEGTRRAPEDGALWFALGMLRRQSGDAAGGRAGLERAAALGHRRALEALAR